MVSISYHETILRQPHAAGFASQSTGGMMAENLNSSYNQHAEPHSVDSADYLFWLFLARDSVPPKSLEAFAVCQMIGELIYGQAD